MLASHTHQANDPQQQLSSLTPLQQQILARIEDCYQQAEAYFKRTFPRPITQFTLRGRSAGTAHLQQNRLRFNPVLLQENSASFLAEVVPHEISHLLCFQLFGKTKPHGREWQSMMLTLFKISPNTTHNFDTQSVKGKDVEYRCACGPIRLSIRRHNKVLRGETRYLCKRCHSHLTLA
ncbi:SprT family zinc-dependent metalloprotease [Shewanella sp. Koi 1]